MASHSSRSRVAAPRPRQGLGGEGLARRDAAGAAGALVGAAAGPYATDADAVHAAPRSTTQRAVAIGFEAQAGTGVNLKPSGRPAERPAGRFTRRPAGRSIRAQTQYGHESQSAS